MSKIELVAGLIQQQNTADREANRKKLGENIRDCAGKGARLVVLQELHDSQYFCQSEDVACFDLAEPIPGPATARYGALARDLKIVLVCSLFERRAPGVYHNTAVVFEQNGSIAGIYRKMHIPDDPGFYEKFYFSPGDLGFYPVKTSVGKLGVLICWDQWFPEAARLMAMRGADMLIYPTAIGWDPQDDREEKERQTEAWITIQRSHAVANGLPVVAVNRVGYEPHPVDELKGVQFWGKSFVCGQQGEMLAQAGSQDEQNLTVRMPLLRTEAVRRIWPFFRDRRIDSYSPLSRRFLDEE